MNPIKKLALYAGIFSALAFGCGDSKDHKKNPTPTIYQCNNQLDDDSDGLIDLLDPGCSSATDNSEYNPPPPVNQAPVINSPNVQYIQPETLQNITYTANVTDPDNNLSSVVVELSIDGYAPHIMDSTGSNNFEYVHTFNDGAVVNARIRATDSLGLDTVSTFSNLPIYLSEADGQQTLQDRINSTIFKTNPFAVDPDFTENFADFNVHLDKIVRFKNPVSGEAYITEANCSNGSIVILEYISRNNDLTINGTPSDPFSSGLDALLTNARQCPGTPNYTNGTIADISRAFIYADNLGTPTTKADIAGIVNSLLTAEDLKINYKPVAQTFTNISIDPDTAYLYDFKINQIYTPTPLTYDPDSYDPDGIIVKYQLNWGDGSPIENSLDGKFWKLYPPSSNSWSTLIETDNEGAQSNTAVTNITTTY